MLNCVDKYDVSRPCVFIMSGTNAAIFRGLNVYTGWSVIEAQMNNVYLLSAGAGQRIKYIL